MGMVRAQPYPSQQRLLRLPLLPWPSVCRAEPWPRQPEPAPLSHVPVPGLLSGGEGSEGLLPPHPLSSPFSLALCHPPCPATRSTRAQRKEPFASQRGAARPEQPDTPTQARGWLPSSQACWEGHLTPRIMWGCSFSGSRTTATEQLQARAKLSANRKPAWIGGG